MFVARLAGVAVFDPAGDQIGRVRDLVITLPVGTKPPRVLGFVVEVQPRRRVFLPVTRVTTIEADAVIFTGRINMRRFEQRGGETLALGELLDRTVELVETGERVSVLDLGMEQTPTRDWLMTKVAVERGRRGLRRRGETLIVDWRAVTGFARPEQGQGAENLVAALAEMRAADLAGVLHDLPPKRRAELAAALSDERLADALEELPGEDQVEIIGTLDNDRAADVLEAMDPDDAADLLSELPDRQAEALLARMEPGEAEPVRRLMVYEDDVAGGMMTTEPVVLLPDATVAEAEAAVRNPDLTPALAATVYVTRPPSETPTGRYLGLVHFQRLLREPPGTLLGALLDTHLDPLRPERTLHEVAGYMAAYNLVALPIVDEVGRLIGVITVDDVLDHLLPRDWRESAPREDPEGSAGGSEGSGDAAGAREAR
ncbi:MAG: CBS domain-containing protein [Streptosporangiales bacterium]|nr:CBS domain-containing protein [Streptosporangiales bacterium]